MRLPVVDMVEPHPGFCMEPNANDRSLLQPADRLLDTSHSRRIRCSSGSNPDCGADIIDNPRGGIIRVLPENLVTHSQSFHV